MQATLKLRTTVLPNNRIEISTPILPTGSEVEVVITLPEMDTPNTAVLGVWDYIQALPSWPRSAATWEEIERNYQEERNAWDR